MPHKAWDRNKNIILRLGVFQIGRLPDHSPHDEEAHDPDQGSEP